MFLDHFDALISKIIFKKIKNYYFNIFLNKKKLYIFIQALRFEFNNKVKRNVLSASKILARKGIERRRKHCKIAEID
jgi:hypothetical protein